MAGKLTDEELFQCLKSLNVPVRLNDIKVPSKEFLTRLLECFITDQQINLSASERNFEAMQHIEHVDMVNEGLKLIQLVACINLITAPCNLVLSYKDVLEPKPKKTRRLLNLLIFYWKYSLQKSIDFQNVEQSIADERKKADELQSEISDLKSKKNELLSLLEKKDISKEELIQIVSDKEVKVSDLSKQHKIVADEYENVVKKKESDLMNYISTLENSITNVKAQISEIEPLILSSPDRLSTEQQRMKDTLKNEDIKIREKEMELKDKNKKIEALKKTKEVNEKCLEVLNETKSLLKEIRQNTDSMKTRHVDIEKEEKQLKKLIYEIEKKEAFLRGECREKDAKISLKTLKHTDSMNEALLSLKNKTTNQLKTLEFLKLKKSELELKINKVVESVLEIVEFSKQAQDLTEKTETAYIFEMETMHKTFLQDCKEVKEEVKKTFHNC